MYKTPMKTCYFCLEDKSYLVTLWCGHTHVCSECWKRYETKFLEDGETPKCFACKESHFMNFTMWNRCWYMIIGYQEMMESYLGIDD